MIKMLVLDIDGTIANKDFELSQKVIDTIKKVSKAGCKVVLATGRMFCSAKHIAKQLELDTPLICYQGALVKNSVEPFDTLFSSTLKEDTARNIISILKERNFHINIYNGDNLIVEQDDDIIRRYAKERLINYSVVDNFDEVKVDKLNKILAIDNTNPDKVLEIQKYLSKLYSDELYIIRSTKYFCEICNKDVSKGLALENLAIQWNIKKEEIMAIGDHDNDIEMLKAAGVKIAMGNGSSSVKEIADFVTDTVDNDGAAKAMCKYILGE